MKFFGGNFLRKNKKSKHKRFSLREFVLTKKNKWDTRIFTKNIYEGIKKIPGHLRKNLKNTGVIYDLR